MSKVLITGSDGYIGSLITQRYLAHTEKELVLCVRAGSEQELSDKQQRLITRYQNHSGRFDIVACNLDSKDPFKSIDPKTVAAVIHTAAVTDFTVTEEVANQVNREGSRKVFQFAECCPNLEKLAYISTVYSAGLKSGTIPEAIHNSRPSFANHYERSKFEAEQILANEYGDLPWSVYRLATVVSEDETGYVSQYNAIHNTLRLLYSGLISIMPGEPETPIYLVTGNYCGDSVFELFENRFYKGQVAHICHSKDESLVLNDVVNIMYRVFEQREEFKRRNILPPLLVELDSFDDVAATIESGFGSAILQQALSSIRPFARQLYVAKDFVCESLHNQLENQYCPDQEKLLISMLEYLIDSKWGRVKLAA